MCLTWSAFPTAPSWQGKIQCLLAEALGAMLMQAVTLADLAYWLLAALRLLSFDYQFSFHRNL